MKNASPNNPHPSRESIAGFAQEPNSPRYADVAEHAARCGSCTAAINRAKKMVAALKNLGTVSPLLRDNNHLSAIDIAQFLSDPDHPNHASWRHHVETCNDCRRALMLHRARLHESSRAPTVATLVWWKKPVPVWATVPLTLAAGIIFALGLAPLLTPPVDKPTVTAYQDDARLFLIPADAPPGLGFFNQPEQHDLPFAGITVSITNESLRLHWPEIENALDYEIQIQAHDAANPRSLIQTRVTSPELRIDRNQLVTGKRYTWELSGIQRDGTRFLTRGGFIFGM